MDDFWPDFEEAKFRASSSQDWAHCCEVLQIAANHQNIDLVAEILKFQGVLIMQELWKLIRPSCRDASRPS